MLTHWAHYFAEAERFELSVPFGTPPFQGGGINRYPTPPYWSVFFYIPYSELERRILSTTRGSALLKALAKHEAKYCRKTTTKIST